MRAESRIKDIEECAVSKAGHDLADKYLKESDAMDMAYAPWIVVNGKHSKEQEDQIWHSLFSKNINNKGLKNLGLSYKL